MLHTLSRELVHAPGRFAWHVVLPGSRCTWLSCREPAGVPVPVRPQRAGPQRVRQPVPVPGAAAVPGAPAAGARSPLQARAHAFRRLTSSTINRRCQPRRLSAAQCMLSCQGRWYGRRKHCWSVSKPSSVTLRSLKRLKPRYRITVISCARARTNEAAANRCVRGAACAPGRVFAPLGCAACAARAF